MGFNSGCQWCQSLPCKCADGPDVRVLPSGANMVKRHGFVSNTEKATEVDSES